MVLLSGARTQIAPPKRFLLTGKARFRHTTFWKESTLGERWGMSDIKRKEKINEMIDTRKCMRCGHLIEYYCHERDCLDSYIECHNPECGLYVWVGRDGNWYEDE